MTMKLGLGILAVDPRGLVADAIHRWRHGCDPSTAFLVRGVLSVLSDTARRPLTEAEIDTAKAAAYVAIELERATR